MKSRIFLSTTLALAVLTACGGGGSSSNGNDQTAQPQSATVITGTAAAGLPIIGTVTIKDSTGRTVTTPIESDGSYKVDLASMSAPFLFRAAGRVNDSEVVYVSTALASDLGKTINITPFTDLIVANIAGKAAAAYFDQPEYSKLDAASIRAATDTLAARIRPVLSELGVDNGFDLLRSAFAANHTKFDAVMDVLKVSVDPASNKAVITDLINQQHIDDDLSSRTDTGALPTPPSGSFTGAISDLASINQWLATFSSFFVSSVPSANNQALQNMFADDFVESGLTKAQFLSTQGVLEADSVGLVVNAATIISRPDSDSMWVQFRYTDGLDTGSVKWLMKKAANGQWQAAGDREIARADIEAVNYRSPYGYNRFLGFNIKDSADNVDSVLVTGPGLPVAGLELVRNVTSPLDISFKVSGLTYDTSWVQSCAETGDSPCVDLTQVASNASYHFAYRDADNKVLGANDVVLMNPPLSNDVAKANAATYFATFDTSLFAPSTAMALTNGQSIQLGWIRPTASDCAPDYLGLTIGNVGLHNNFENGGISQSSNGKQSATVGVWSGASPTSQGNAHIHVHCASTDRFFVTGTAY